MFVLLVGTNSGNAEETDYSRDIKPVLRAKCYSCHGALQQEAGLRLDTVALMRTGGDSGSALDQVAPKDSLLWLRISASDPDERMPPQGEPLSAAQQRRVLEWLRQGAPAPEREQPQADPAEHWSFQPLSNPKVPGDLHPIDGFVDRKLRQAGLGRADPADPVTLIRRAFLDLHGLPPTPKDLDRWVPALSETPGSRSAAFQELVDTLLSSPRYGERWGQHWLDIVRYADTHGYEVNTPRPNAWPYRDYVIQAFNEDKPYSQFVFEQLAGDTTGHDAATGFMVAAAALLPGQIGKDEESKRLARQDELDEIIVGTSATFLGLTVGCARCHDHKFDPISQQDYYAMQAFFAGVRYGDRPIMGRDRQNKLRMADDLQPKIEKLRRQLQSFQQPAFAGRTIVIDDEDSTRVTSLQKKNGHGTNPDGADRGYRNDVGGSSRGPNLSRGRYTWWDNIPGQDVFTWNPGVAGSFQIWISWGVHGSGVHTRDAGYVLDRDGNLQTQADQKEIAQADQYYFAGQTTGESEQKPLWSGLANAGVHQLTEESRLVLRGGTTGTGITADVIVLQEANTEGTPRPAPVLRAPVSPLRNTEVFAPTKAKFVRFTSLQTIDNNKHQPCLDELEVFTAEDSPRNVALASNGTIPSSSGSYSTTGKHQLKHINDGRYGNSYSWISNEYGRGWVQVEFPRPETIDRIEWARDREGKFPDRLPVSYRIEVSMNGTDWQLVAGSDDRVASGTPFDPIRSLLLHQEVDDEQNVPALAEQLESLQQQQVELRKPQMAFAGIFGQPDVTYVLNRGDPEQRIEEIAPHVLSSMTSVRLTGESSDTERRKTLAEWLVSADNPLAARVIANRIWQYHFGVGIVETPSDFGLNGAQPSHPKLLDWLASDMVANDWSVKHLHRLIMSSGTYQQASSVSQNELASRALSADRGNRLLWRFPSRRLEAESIRDSILQVSGDLNLKMGGPGFNFFQTRGGLSGFPPLEKFTTAEKRRMIYAHRIRMEPVPVFGAFDCPDAGLPTPRRSQSTTAIQALNLFNSPFVIAQADRFAEQAIAAHPESPEAQVDYCFRHAVGRNPRAVEKSTALDSVVKHGPGPLCRALLNSSEFLFIP